LEQVLSRALKSTAEALKFAGPDSLNGNALPACGRAKGSLGIGRGNEGSDLSHEIGEGRFLAKEYMICAVKIHKARSGYASR
jgi:hypothetical protein